MSDTDDYTPTTEDVWGWVEQDTLPGDVGMVRGQFVRWLTTVKADAWDEGFDAGERDAHEHKTFDEPCIPNPYRDTTL